MHLLEGVGRSESNGERVLLELVQTCYSEPNLNVFLDLDVALDHGARKPGLPFRFSSCLTSVFFYYRQYQEPISRLVRPAKNQVFRYS